MSDIIFRRLDEHNQKIVELQIKQGVQEALFKQMESKHADICEQLITTRTELVTMVSGIDAKQDRIMQEQSRAEGAKLAYKSIPLILGVIVVLLQIWQLLGKH